MISQLLLRSSKHATGARRRSEIIVAFKLYGYALAVIHQAVALQRKPYMLSISISCAEEMMLRRQEVQVCYRLFVQVFMSDYRKARTEICMTEGSRKWSGWEGAKDDGWVI